MKEKNKKGPGKSQIVRFGRFPSFSVLMCTCWSWICQARILPEQSSQMPLLLRQRMELGWEDLVIKSGELCTLIIRCTRHAAPATSQKMQSHTRSLTDHTQVFILCPQLKQASRPCEGRALLCRKSCHCVPPFTQATRIKLPPKGDIFNYAKFIK